MVLYEDITKEVLYIAVAKLQYGVRPPKRDRPNELLCLNILIFEKKWVFFAMQPPSFMQQPTAKIMI